MAQRFWPAALLTLALAQVDALAADIETHVVSIDVAKPVEGFEADGEMEEPLSRGTRIGFLLVSEKKRIVEVVEEKCSVELLEDDTGVDLVGAGVTGGPFGAGMDVAQCSVLGSGTPSPGARSVRVRATVTLVTARLKVAKKKNVALKPGQTIKVGGVPISMEEAGMGQLFDEEIFKVTLAFRKRPEMVHEVEFLDRDGELLECQQIGSSSSVDPDPRGRPIVSERTISYGFTEPVEKATLRLRYFTKKQTEKLKIDATVGLALDEPPPDGKAPEPVIEGADDLDLSVQGIVVRADTEELVGFGLAHTTARLLVKSPDLAIVELSHASSVNRLADDTGQELSAGPPQLVRKSSDHRSVLVEVEAMSVPARGATNLELAGTLVFRLAATRKEQAEGVKLEAGTTFEAAGLQCQVSEVGDAWANELDRQVTIQLSGAVRSVLGVQLIGSDGRPLVQEITSSSSNSSGGTGTRRLTISYAGNPATATVEIQLLEGDSEATVELESVFGLGLAGK